MKYDLTCLWSELTVDVLFRKNQERINFKLYLFVDGHVEWFTDES